LSLLSGISRFFGTSAPAVNGSAVDYRAQVTRRTRLDAAEQRDIYAVLRAFYLNSDLYEYLRSERFMVTANTPNLKPLRNPIPAAIDFFSVKSWPEPLELTSPRETTDETSETTDPVLAAIEQVWQWSNWPRRREMVAHCAALYGECYLKVVADPIRGRVWFEVIEPQYVQDFEDDERDYLTWLRLDVPKCDINRETGETREYTRTEVWSKDDGTYRVWHTDGDQYGKPLNSLGAVRVEESGTLAELGIDFLPFIRIVFKDVGQKRGLGAVQGAIEPVVEADLMATHLHGTLFTSLDETTVITRDGTDANGRTLPAVQLPNATPAFDALGRELRSPGANADGSVTIGNSTLMSLPGGAHVEFLVPPIAYEAALNIQQDHDAHIEHLVPALAYSRLGEMGTAELSGRAIRYRLSAAIDQILMVRAHLLAGLKQADEIALTLGQVNGIFQLPGSFDSGAFEHGFAERDVIPISDFEDSQTLAQKASAFSSFAAAGLPLAENLKLQGYADDVCGGRRRHGGTGAGSSLRAAARVGSSIGSAG
jgi:hypothetical protein